MGGDRILLMNNDSKLLAVVNDQGYYDTNTSASTYWVHKGTSLVTSPAKYMLAGTNHIMYANDGTKLWELFNCRAGSATVLGNARNYIPWSKTAKSILDSSANIPVTDEGVRGVGSVIMRNMEDACIYSPYYEEGIWTIYADMVNAFKNAISTRLTLEVATNVTYSAREEGLQLSSTDDYSKMDWRPCPFTVFTVEGTELTEIASGVTNVTLASEAGGAGLF